MKRIRFLIPLVIIIPVLFQSCTSGSGKVPQKKQEPVAERSTSPIQLTSVHADWLKKFKPISFDTLKITYHYNTKDKRFTGTALTLKEAKLFPLGITENYSDNVSGVYACYQFPLDSTRIGLIARIPGEYEVNSIGFFVFDRIKDRLEKEYMQLSVDFGDAGDVYSRSSWLIKTKNKRYQSLVYDYSAYYHEVEDTSDHTVDEWEEYYLFDCMTSRFDTLSKNEIRLKKQFKNLLKKSR